MGRRCLRPGPPATTGPIFLSIGYSACHWCHVMAHESFEDPASRGHAQRLVRVHQGRPRGASRRRRRLHGGGAGHDRLGRLADERVPDPGSAPVLRRHLLPSRRPARACRRSRTVLAALTDVWDQPAARGRGAGRRALRGHRLPLGHRAAAPGPGRCSPTDGDGSRRRTCWTGPSTSWPAASIPSGAGSAAPPSSPSPPWSTWPSSTPLRRPPDGAGRPLPADGDHHPRRHGRRRHPRPPRRRVRPLLDRRPSGWCPTSRRCSTTRPDCCGPSSTGGRSPATRTTWR